MVASGQIDGPKALPFISAFLNDPNPDVRRRFPEALARIGGDAAFALLSRAFPDGDQDVKAEVSRGLNRWTTPIGRDEELGLGRIAVADSSAAPGFARLQRPVGGAQAGRMVIFRAIRTCGRSIACAAQ
jgi:hypothetical protein